MLTLFKYLVKNFKINLKLVLNYNKIRKENIKILFSNFINNQEEITTQIISYYKDNKKLKKSFIEYIMNNFQLSYSYEYSNNWWEIIDIFIKILNKYPNNKKIDDLTEELIYIIDNLICSNLENKSSYSIYFQLYINLYIISSFKVKKIILNFIENNENYNENYTLFIKNKILDRTLKRNINLNHLLFDYRDYYQTMNVPLLEINH